MATLDHLACPKNCPDLPIYIFHDYHCDKWGVEREGGRKEDYTFSTLPEDEDEDAMEHLLAKFALTMMPALRIGRSVRFRKSDVDSWLAKLAEKEAA